MDDPNYLSETVAAEGRALCMHLLEPDADVYWRAADILGLIGMALPDDAPGRLYIVWACLTDRWELAPERQSEAEDLMRDAAAEFVAMSDYAGELDDYLSRWYGRMRIPD